MRKKLTVSIVLKESHQALEVISVRSENESPFLKKTH